MAAPTTAPTTSCTILRPIPASRFNLAEREPVRRDDLARRLREWRRCVGAQEMTPNPDYNPTKRAHAAPPPPGDPRQFFWPMNTLILQQPKRIIFGDGTSRTASAEFLQQGWKKPFVVTSPQVGEANTALFAGWQSAGLAVTVCTEVSREPEIGLFETVLAAARAAKPDVIVGFGGGSPLDVSKLVAALFDGREAIRSRLWHRAAEGPRAPAGLHRDHGGHRRRCFAQCHPP